ncbi:MAG: nicotinate (nicotinamide) nucleotide adenylyltransferase [Bacteroidetes bacterium]|nr:nicotinate (nicotinamide) nucleotide adenylyltransferase [Bacteroidota bacterium]
MKKTGLFFGSFNPIHIGHLVIANQMLANSDIDEVWFVISPHNPLKEKQSLLKDYHRLALVKTAIEDDPRLKACDIEFKLPQPSYTIHTLVNLEELYPDRSFVLIIGSDNLNNFKKWYNYEEILRNYQLYVYPRPNYNGGEFAHHPAVKWVASPLMEISSSYIRNAIQQGLSVKYLLPEKVLDYILEMHFYENK